MLDYREYIEVSMIILKVHEYWPCISLCGLASAAYQSAEFLYI